MVSLSRLPRRAVALGPITAVVVGVVAFVARLEVVLTGGGFHGNIAYDGAVYYAAADALTFGRLPYRDFVLVHPPGIMLTLTPFAALGRLTTDHIGFAIAMLATMAAGALNSALVVLLARRLGLGLIPAAIGGLFYAVWGSSVLSEYVIRLEPFGNTCLLLGLLLCLDLTRTRGLRLVLGGAALGAAVSIKIWWAVPLLLVLAWFVPAARRHLLPRVAVGAAASIALINGPFFAAAPRQMLSMVVTDQFARTRTGTLAGRLRQLVGLGGVDRYLGRSGTHLLVAALVIAAAVVLARALRVRQARLVAVLAIAQLALLLASPSWYPYYADFLTPALALSVAAAAARVPARSAEPSAERRSGRRAGWGAGWGGAGWLPRLVTAAVAVLVLVVGGFTLRLLAVGPNRVTVAFPSGRIAALVRHDRCVMSDSPMGPILINTLSVDLARGCPNWIDVTGRSLGADALFNRQGVAYSRPMNPRWQRDVMQYLRSGQAALIVRQPTTGLRSGAVRLLGKHVLAHGHGYALYGTPHGRQVGATSIAP